MWRGAVRGLSKGRKEEGERGGVKMEEEGKGQKVEGGRRNLVE